MFAYQGKDMCHVKKKKKVTVVHRTMLGDLTEKANWQPPTVMFPQGARNLRTILKVGFIFTNQKYLLSYLAERILWFNSILQNQIKLNF